jgi:hypothetical protein
VPVLSCIRIRRSQLSALLVTPLLIVCMTTTTASAAPLPTRGWTSLGGTLTANPATAVDTVSGAVFHLARGTDGALWRYLEGGDDGLGAGWRRVGGKLVGGPAATLLNAGDGDAVAVAVRGIDNAVWVTYAYPTGPTTYVWDTRGFFSQGGSVTSDPAIALGGDTRLWLFARGVDGALWLNSLQSGSTWQSLGGQMVGGPGAAGHDLSGPGFVAVQGADHALWTRSWTGCCTPSWSAWTTLGGRLTSDPDVAFDCHNGEEVAATGIDNALWVRSPSTPWTSHGGSLTSGPSIGWASDATTSSFAQDGRGADNALWTRTDNAGC